MRLLCLSNGHGEDAIALRILQALQRQPHPPELAALPLVGAGHAFERSGIPIVGPVKQMPSGGFVYQDGRQLMRDLKGGLLQLTLAQLKTVRAWGKSGGHMLAVGDIVPLLFAWYSGAPYAFVGTAKSEYYLRDEAGLLPRRTWFEKLESLWGSVYLPWERWLMGNPRCKAVFPRDRLTSETLAQFGVPAFDLGNPMMDGLEPSGSFASDADADPNPPLTFVLLPGSRPPEAYENWQVILEAVAGLVTSLPQKLRFFAAIAPGLDPHLLHQTLASNGWHPTSSPSPTPSTPPTYTYHHSTLSLALPFNDCIHRADLAIAMAGTATEQFVGLGKPAIILPGKGPQFTPAFAEAQTRLLGPSVILVKRPSRVAAVVEALLQDPDRLQLIAENGRRRMGEAGAAARIAQCLMAQMQ